MTPEKLDDPGRLFDAAYYKTHLGPVPYERSPRWTAFFGQVADHLIQALYPKRVLDAGCALGLLVEAFWDRGVEALGIDISSYAIENVRRDMRPYCRVGTISKHIEGWYDLITCIEVVEHMPEDEAIAAIGLICRSTNTVLFSSSSTDFNEPTHFNVRPAIYWLRLFQNNGFDPDLQFDASFVAPHAMLLRKTERSYPLEVLQSFANLLRAREQVVAKDNQYNEAVLAGQQADARAAREKAELERRLAEAQDMLGKTESACQVFSEQQGNVRDQLSGLADKLDRVAQLVPVMDQDRLAQYELRLDGLEAEAVRTGEEIRRLEQMLAQLHEEVAGVSHSVQSVLQSRIWRTLMRGGAVLLRAGGLVRTRR